MDLVAGVKNIFIIMQHNTKEGQSKIVNKCSFPLTGKNVVKKIYTNLAIINVMNKKLFVQELAPEISFDFLQSQTDAKLYI